MTGQRPDTEQIIRNWLADSAPSRAPASLKETLEDGTSRPPGGIRSWPRVTRNTLLGAARIAAAVAILTIAASSIYLYDSNRAISPAERSSDSALPSASPAASSPAASPSGSASPAPSASPAGTSWRLVDGGFPKLKADFASNQKPVFALSTGGFLAFMSDGSAVTRDSQSGGDALAAPRSAGSSVAPASLVTRVFWSGDGTTWNEKSSLPTRDATVSAVAESGGLIVAVGWTGDAPAETAMAWTSSDLQTWRATKLTAPEGAGSRGVAAGPAGLLAWGLGEGPTPTEFWVSADGVAWRSLATSGLPAEGVDELYAIPGGYAIRGYLSDRAAVWRSNDGATWTRAWTGPGPSDWEYSMMGPIAKATDGSYVSFGVVAVGTGVGSTVPFDLLVWASSDLVSWTPSARVPAPGWMNGFAAVPGGFVAAGAQPAAGDAGVVSWGPLSVWTSPDGRTWHPLVGIVPTDPIEVLSVVGDGTHAVVTFVDRDGNVRMLVGSGPH
jgi:hypothetical protein